MSIIQGDAGKELLRRSGFSPEEIAQLDNSKAKDGTSIQFDVTSNSAQQMIREREQWVRHLKNQDWTDDQIDNEIDGYYTRHDRASVFDFLKAEYRPNNKRRDYWQKVQSEKRSNISSSLNGYYSSDIAFEELGQEEESEEQEEMESEFAEEKIQENEKRMSVPQTREEYEKWYYALPEQDRDWYPSPEEVDYTEEEPRNDENPNKDEI